MLHECKKICNFADSNKKIKQNIQTMIKILHTSDWHIGQVFYGEDRIAEQQHMLAQITDCVTAEKPDIMLLAGDIFDVAMPNSKAQKLLTDALMAMHTAHPQMAIITISGNHDSATRHEIHQAVWESVNVHMIGNIHNSEVNQHLLPIYDANGQVCAYVAAVPYAAQRMITNDFYTRLSEHAARLGEEHQVPVIFVGHLAASSCESTGHAVDNYGKDTIYIGNIETVDVAELGSAYDYVALGHIHKAQNLGNRARYSGSPIAMSFDEVASDYRHSISIVEIASRGALPVIREVEIDNALPLVNIPAVAAAEWDKVLAELTDFPCDIPARIRLNVLLDAGESLSYNHEWQVKEALVGKCAHHCETNVQRAQQLATNMPKSQEVVRMELAELLHMQPIDVARKWMGRIGEEMTDEMEQLFNHAISQAIEIERHED